MVEKICGNCAHWMRTFKGGKYSIEYADEKGEIGRDYFSPCAIHAVEADAGNAVALMTKNGHCICHSDAFEPADFYLEELAEQENVLDEAAFNGVIPGRDFPGTLNQGLL